MNFTTVEVPGTEAVQMLDWYRSRYSTMREYPFLIGDRNELERVAELPEFDEDERDAAEIIQTSMQIDIADWVRRRQNEAEEEGWFSTGKVLGDWPGEVSEKGSISLHATITSGRIKPTVFIGLASIEEPWHLPAVLRYGGWNACPEPEVHCAFYRYWQQNYGAEITGASFDIIECALQQPPKDSDGAIKLAWEQYWYCGDIVDQGCGSVSKLAATLLNSPYWFFWWD
jgi:hypothetical protein